MRVGRDGAVFGEDRRLPTIDLPGEIDQFFGIVFGISIGGKSPTAAGIRIPPANPRLTIELLTRFAGGGSGEDEPVPKRPTGNPKSKPTYPNANEQQKVLKTYLINAEWADRPFREFGYNGKTGQKTTTRMISELRKERTG